MSDESDGVGRKFLALYVGTVVDVADPESLARVRVRIPGVAEPASWWAFPLGGAGGGGKRRGLVFVPPVGAEVGVFFHAGDVDRPYYLPGNWGAGEVPGPVGGYSAPNADGSAGAPQDIPADEAHKIVALETDSYVFVIDERTGRKRLTIEDKKTGDHLALDGQSGALEIRATSYMRIICDGNLDIEASELRLRGRVVLPNGKAILWPSTLAALPAVWTSKACALN